LTDTYGVLIDWGGDLLAYGIKGLRRGELAVKQIFFLEGFLPPHEKRLVFSCVKAGTGLSADIHIFSSDQGDWTLLLDATEAEILQKRFQQKSNELRLLRQELSRVIDRRVGKKNNIKQFHKILAFREKGEYRETSILFADVQDFTTYVETTSPEAMLITLDRYLNTMTRPIYDEAGMLDKIIGDEVMAIFGLLPASEHPANQAVRAALKIQESIKELNKLRVMEKHLTFNVGVGIASGPVAVGMIEHNDRQTMTAIGGAVNLAAYLEQQTRQGEILIDNKTYQQIKDVRHYFSKINLKARGIGGLFQVFSCEV
jgi:class 3 adenylate cyclase